MGFSLDFQSDPFASNEPASRRIGKPKLVPARRYFYDRPGGYGLTANYSVFERSGSGSREENASKQ
jgi:hypothetical protein